MSAVKHPLARKKSILTLMSKLLQEYRVPAVAAAKWKDVKVI